MRQPRSRSVLCLFARREKPQSDALNLLLLVAIDELSWRKIARSLESFPTIARDCSESAVIAHLPRTNFGQCNIGLSCR